MTAARAMQILKFLSEVEIQASALLFSLFMTKILAHHRKSPKGAQG